MAKGSSCSIRRDCVTGSRSRSTPPTRCRTDVQLSAQTDPRLQGLRVIVVEDETLVAILLEDMLAELGCEVLWTAHRVGKALDLVATSTPDAAVLDVNIAGDEVYPVAQALAARDIPFVFATGYGARGLKDAWRERPILQKPFQVEHLGESLLMALGRRGELTVALDSRGAIGEKEGGAGPVAQWSEPTAHNGLVGGSSPPGPTSEIMFIFQLLVGGRDDAHGFRIE